MSPTTRCLMRWLRLHWRSFSRTCTSEKTQCRRAACSERRPIPRGRQTAHIFEPPELMKLYKVFQIYSVYAYRMMMFKISIQNVPSSLSREWNNYGNCPGGSIQVKSAGFCSASDCIGSVWPREYSKQRTTELCKIEDISTTSYWSDNEDAKLQSLERNSGKRSSNQESKGKKVRAERKVGDCSAVESNWTMFERRLM